MTPTTRQILKLRRFGSRRWQRRTPLFGMLFEASFRRRLEQIINFTIRDRSLLKLMEERANARAIKEAQGNNPDR